MLIKITKIALVGVIGVGTLVGSSSIVSAEAAEPGVKATYDSKAKVMFEANTDITDPVDPENPDPTKPVDPTDPVEPGTEGPLSIDYVSNFDFGTQKTSGNAETYTAKPVEITLSNGDVVERAPYAQVTDNRGTHAGWTLTVAQPEQLNNGTADLEGAQITIGEGTVTGTPKDKEGVVGKAVNLSENAQPVFTAANEAKGGTWVNSFGTVNEVNVELSIPAGTKIEQGTEYTTDLNWKLTDAPGN